VISKEKRAQLTWRCRRGMLELDLLLCRFVERRLDSLSAVQLEAFETLLACDDPDIYAWCMGYSPVQEELEEIVELIRFHH